MNGEALVKTSNDAYMTLELLVGIVAIIIPFLLFLSEVYRCEHYVREMVFSAQHQCLEAAFNGNKSDNVNPQSLPITLKTNVTLLAFTQRYFKSNWQPPVQHFSKTYVIYSGTGKSGN